MFSKSNKRKLSDDQIRHLRDLYFNHLYSRKQLAEKFNISSSLVQAIVEYRNGYKNIQDSIPEEVKQSRKPARETYAWHRIAAKNQSTRI